MKQTTKLLLIVIIVAFCIPSTAQQKERIFPILGSQIKASKNMTAPGNEKGQTVKFEIKERGFVPFTQSCVRQTNEQVQYAPKADIPYFTVRFATSDDNGATWTLNIPHFDKRPTDFTAQPITNAFRDPQGNIYMAMDAKGSHSFLWRSKDEGKTWHF